MRVPMWSLTLVLVLLSFAIWAAWGGTAAADQACRDSIEADY